MAMEGVEGVETVEQILLRYHALQDEPAHVPRGAAGPSTSRYDRMIGLLAAHAFAPPEPVPGVPQASSGGEQASCVYKIEKKESGKAYIGRSRHHEKRWQSHITRDNGSYIGRSLRKHGEDAFTFEVVTTCTIAEEGLYEMFYTVLYATLSPAGYNLIIGGIGVRSVLFSAEMRAKMSAGRLGHTPSQETRAKMSAARLGMKMSNQTRARMSAARMCTAVDKYTIEGSFVDRFSSIKLAAASVGKGARGLSSTSFTGFAISHGHRWLRVKDTAVEPVRDIGALPVKLRYNCRAVVQLTREGEFVERHDTIDAAAKAVGAFSSNICAVLSGCNSTCKGFIFDYAEAWEELEADEDLCDSSEDLCDSSEDLCDSSEDLCDSSEDE